MKKIFNISFIFFAFILLQNCEEENGPTSLDYVSFAKSAYSTGVDVGGSTTFDIVVYTANKVGSDKTFNVTVDAAGTTAAAGSYTVPSTVTVPAGTNEGVLTVALSDVNLGIGVNKLVIKFTDNEGFFVGGSTALSYIQNCTEVTGTFDIRFNYGEEASWNIKDSLGGIIASGSYTGSTSAYTTLSIPITLCAGRSYTLTTTDSYGDGWGATGSYSLTIGGVVKVSGNGSLMDNGGTGTISSTVPFTTN